ncbi:hypothetical protein Poly24_10290 [Rosistilla carotiformis]|uniref:Uncharacterized protein n=1 Tax=Rosistilla carotiformis TaxID=2528017 RepID=A0A518JP65_9BACT|nr:hypothetical protein Poly24_10290 [Rosistilla carotiformis]
MGEGVERTLDSSSVQEPIATGASRPNLRKTAQPQTVGVLQCSETARLPGCIAYASKGKQDVPAGEL